MIRFSAVLVAVAVGVLVAGVVTSRLLFVYVAIGVSGAALVALAIGVVLKRAELFGEPGAAPGPAAAGASAEEPRLPSHNQVLPNGPVDSPGTALPAGGSAALPFGQFPPDAGNSRDAVRAAAQGGQQGGQGTPGFAPPGYGQPAQGTPSGREQSGREMPAARGDRMASNAPAQDTPARSTQGREKAAPWDTPARESAAREVSSWDSPGREAAAWNAPAWDAPPREAPSWQPPQPLGTVRPDAPPPDAPPPAVPPERPGREGRAGDEDRSAGPFRSRDLWGPSAPAAPLSPASASGSAAPPAPPSSPAQSRADRPSRSFEPFGAAPSSSPADPPARPGRDRPAAEESRQAAPSWFDRPARLRRDAEEDRPAARDTRTSGDPDTPREAERTSQAAEPRKPDTPRDAEASPRTGTTPDVSPAREADAAPKADATSDPKATPETDATSDVAATRAEPMLKADRTPEAEPPKSKAAFTVGSQGETVETARVTAKPTDDDSAGEPAASAATPAAAATREAKSGSADAEPAKPAETARSADRDDKPPAARDSGTGQQRQVTVVPGVPRYHTDNCILIRFMDDDDVQQMSLKSATDAGCTPCGACQPDD